MASLTLIVGIPYVCALWATGLRKAPRLKRAHLATVFPVAMAHCFAHLAAVVSLGAGAVGFVQIVKAAEPLFTAALSAALLGQVLAWPVYLTLLPVVAGVAVASLQELSFSATALAAAMCSNTFAATRSVIGKRAMGRDKGENMDAGNLYAVMTMMATCVLTPLALVLEGPKLRGLWAAAVAAGASPGRLWRDIALSGVFFYLYNEVAFYCLNAIHPLTHGIGNTIKRVVMIAVSVIAFHHRFTPLGVVGSATAIGGVLLYSIVKGHYDEEARKLAKRQAAAVLQKL
ncbi:triosephosphate/phosphate translocator [Tribonema minus]|uniref:Triosephosphate/phosphate translocator n=1 Tax=Tribonema minus TaxID=303371 RepID=A0A835YPU6_9STRA|nr:triosephosphate/phosphate translocator [Tribonema minus]